MGVTPVLGNTKIMEYETTARPSNETHVLTADKDYIGIAQKRGGVYYHDFDDMLLIYNPATKTAERVHDGDCHVTFRCAEFHPVD